MLFKMSPQLLQQESAKPTPGISWRSRLDGQPRNCKFSPSNWAGGQRYFHRYPIFPRLQGSNQLSDLDSPTILRGWQSPLWCLSSKAWQTNQLPRPSKCKWFSFFCLKIKSFYRTQVWLLVCHFVTMPLKLLGLDVGIHIDVAWLSLNFILSKQRI